MQFQPSVHSYGQADAEVETAVVTSSGGGGADVGQYVDIGVSAVKSLLGLDSGERESVATIEGQIDVAKKKRDNNAFPGGWYWDDRVIKLTSQLGAAKELAAEEKRAADIATARDIGYTVAVFAGVVLMGGFAINQIQKARRQQAEIERLSKG
jgi:hypothetical protein